MITRSIPYFLALMVVFFLASCASTPASPEGQVGETLPSAMEDSEIIPIGGSYSYGPSDAPIVIVEFVSLQCPFCARGAQTVRELQARYPDEIQVVYKHLPLSFQPQAGPAALVSEAAGRQGYFFEMTTAILNRMDQLRAKDALTLGREIAAELGMDLEQFEEDLLDTTLEESILADMMLAQDLRIQGTPNFYINGIHVRGAQPLEAFDAVVRQARNFNKSLAESGVPKEQHYRLSVENFFAAPPQEQEQAQNLAPELRTGDLLEIPIQDFDLTYGEQEDFLVTIVEYSSLQCPFCARASTTMRQLEEMYPGKIRFVFKHFPLENHQHSITGGRALYAADQQGQGQKMLHLLYDNQTQLRRLAEDDYLELARELELDLEQFTSDYHSEESVKVIQENQNYGVELGIRGTPFFVVNGEVVIGAFPVHHFREIIEAELRSARTLRERENLRGQALYEALLEQKLQ